MEKHTFRDWWRGLDGMGWLSVSLDTYHRWWGNPIGLRVQGKLWQCWYYLRCRYWRHYNRVEITTLSPTWHDRDHILLHASFQILVDYVEQEHPHDRIEWEDSHHLDDYQEVFTLYDWWTNVRSLREDPTRWWVAQCAKAGVSTEVRFDPPDPVTNCSRMHFGVESQAEARADILMQSAAMEQAQEDEDTEMLCRLARVRGTLWT